MPPSCAHIRTDGGAGSGRGAREFRTDRAPYRTAVPVRSPPAADSGHRAVRTPSHTAPPARTGIATKITACEEYRTRCDMNPPQQGKERTGTNSDARCAAGIPSPSPAPVWEDSPAPHGSRLCHTDTPDTAASHLSWRPGGRSPLGAARAIAGHGTPTGDDRRGALRRRTRNNGIRDFGSVSQPRSAAAAALTSSRTNRGAHCPDATAPGSISYNHPAGISEVCTVWP